MHRNVRILKNKNAISAQAVGLGVLNTVGIALINMEKNVSGVNMRV